MHIENFNEAVPLLLNMIRPVEKMSYFYSHVINDLQKVLCQKFPNCTVHPFGSTVTGLATYSSDIDIYVDVPNKNHTTPSTLVKQSKQLLLTSNPRYFKDVIAIPNAKTPIVRCVHIKTMIKCDFNFKSYLGVCNSNLIKYYTSLGNKVYPFFMLLKYWAKSHELMNYQTKFTNYSLIMIAIFYLQQNPYFLPPVIKLQENSYYQYIQDGWNGNFTPICNFSSQPLNTVDLHVLLRGFFEFYSKFDYTIYIICPYLGRNLLKTDFLKPNLLHPSFNRYKENIKTVHPLNVETPICVQDPFELNHNVTKAMKESTLEEFVSLCKLAFDILSTKQPSLFKLITEKPEILVGGATVTNDYCHFKITMGSCLSYVHSKIDENTTDSSMLIKEQWFSCVNRFVTDVLQKILYFDISEERNVGNKSHKAKEETDVYDNDYTFIHCRGNYNLWEARKSAASNIIKSEQGSIFEEETCISDYIKNVLYKDVEVKEPIIEFDVILKNKLTKPACVEIELKKISCKKKNSFTSLAVLLFSKVPKWFLKYQQELNSKIKEDQKKKNKLEEVKASSSKKTDE